MTTETKNTDPEHCPTCGSPMQHVPGETNAVCHVCNPPMNMTEMEDSSETSSTEAQDENIPAVRFRKLMAHSEEIAHQWPEDLLEDLPEEARDLLRGLKGSSSKQVEELSEDIASTLRDQGYVINLDAHGVRISGGPSSRSSDSGTLSPYDVVRLAADLEGGVPSPDQRKHCPKCDAVIPHGENRCSWCGEPLPPDPESSPET